LLVDELRAIPQRYPHLDVAVLHLGGTTLPGGLVVTMDGAAGAELVQLLAPTRAVPIHYDDYRVFRSPLSHFEAEIARRGLSDIVDVVRRGDIRALPCRRVAS
jgi:L-ascorbate metabolism protein UlaG (beta-lactamase superfamily)